MNYLENILAELSNSAKNIDNQNISNEIIKSNQIFTHGLGRSGLVLKMFAMRLAQLGHNSNVVGETTTKSIHKDDLLILASGSGNTAQVKIVAQEAKKVGANIILITSNDDSEIGKIADHVVNIHSKSKYDHNKSITIQPMGSLFEQTLMLYLDSMVLQLMNDENINESNMIKNHANLE
ncbi:6-phospho-3-hexuloisomerase [Apilactobacillus timberlakei]|uniref:6-phospho-3-hexuloisomerase n=1 Tax=Apilactobacillus timberlakei TaxID=2008380 RepID=UPI001126CB1D|nr:6-phospho-3-hexuloisomerase [Apilactobacillus timberlakei]TPR20131.1 6-phospho-3-hexuloisomerase [Apilactobacillus timberlakei]TPR20444.1 6-phospho-3-hexuloisomerase [Apilactobacillus timberlakei]TPR21849.1 6-phospho-3-hexuloisomerase [Apilactobacillus timberlakei]